MSGQTYAEKFFSKKAGNIVQTGEIVFVEPDIVLSHDNSASIEKTFNKMGGKHVKFPERLIIVLDHDAPPTNTTIANDHENIRNFVRNQNINMFYDVGEGICHQLMSNHVKPGQLVVGSDSHTCTSGAFGAFAAGIDRTETAGLWLTGQTWFRIPESIKVILTGSLPKGVYAKDIALYLMSYLSSSGANYNAIEFHGLGLDSLSISERMTLANLASEMGAKTAIFPFDAILASWLKNRKEANLTFPIKENQILCADPDANYLQEIKINLNELIPLVAAPHNVDNIKSINEVIGTQIQQAFLGTCTNARLDDLLVAASIVKGKHIKNNIQFLVAPASQQIYQKAIEKGAIQTLVMAGATILTSSCGPCLGKGQGIPADNWNIISTANRNFLGRMGNKKASIYLASPATVAASAIAGIIVDPRKLIARANNKVSDSKIINFLDKNKRKTSINHISPDENRKYSNIWYYGDIDNFNTDQMFGGALTYDIKSSEPEKIVPHLFKGLDESFASKVEKNDIIIAGKNFGCGSSREHPAVGLAFIGVKAIIAKSVSRIFYRAAVNQGLPIIVHPEFVENFSPEIPIDIDLNAGKIFRGEKEFTFPKLPSELLSIFNSGGLIKFYRSSRP